MKHVIIFSVITFSLLISSCVPKLDIPDPSPGNANFSKTIAIGGDFMAGYQDDGLYMKGQQYCIPALLAEQFKLVGGTMFNQALMPDNNGIGLNSKPWESWFVTPAHLGYRTDCAGVTSLFPNKNAISVSAATPYLVGIAGNTVQNMSVPFANTADYFNPAFGAAFSPATNRNPYYNRFASLPGVSTLYADAKAQN